MWVIIKLILYYFGYQLGFMALFMASSKYVAPMDAVTVTSLVMVASTLAMAWHLVRYGYVRVARTICREVSLQVLAVSVVFVFAVMYVANLIVEQADIPNIMEDTFIAMSRNAFGVLSIALLGPILEELLFRGAIQDTLQCMTPRPWVAIVGASLIFGVVHMNPAQIPFAFFLGMVFGWLRYRTGSLLPGIVGHVLNNSVACVNMMLYGNASLEEQMGSSMAMWVWVVVAVVAFVLSAWWLDRHLDARPVASAPAPDSRR